MEEYYYRRSHVPAFGSWDWNDNLPFTECFESATQGGFFRYTFSDSDHQDRDLYVAGDLYQNDVVTPAMIVVPRPTKTKVKKRQAETGEEKHKWESEFEGTRSSSTNTDHIIGVPRPAPKPVDEDLYRISPELLYQKHRKKRGLGIFSSCLLPACIA
ncbi:uncharacterized protein LOC129291490 [Prosopis cineraria]|uniref:uncharacterized protein LOC129291490 n=1 Tax=Prosopis cineraria TaxID=364024 RepID=UPI00241078A5|nr:uncharacterized protein LOC129291490 [Prosopis cineraria]